MSRQHRPFLSFPISLSPSKLLVLSTLLFALSSTANAATKVPPTADPFADPKHDVNNPLRYIASNTLTAIATTAILLIGIAQTWSIYKWGGKWMASMTVGAYCFALGLAFRFALHTKPDGKGIYIAQYLLVVLSPCLFIAADYVILGRLANHLDADKHLLIRSRRLTLIFVLSDVSTFIVQAMGGTTITSSKTPKGQKTGSDIFLGGLVAQLVSFAVFCVLSVVFLYRVRKSEPRIWKMDDHKPWFSRWKTLAWALIVSCIGILIRSGYRVAEFAEVYPGHLATTEGYFYVLDTLPLFIAIGVYIPFWPGRFIPEKQPKVEEVPLSPSNGTSEHKDSEDANLHGSQAV